MLPRLFFGVRMKRADIIAGILGLALSGYIFFVTAGFPEDQVVRVGPAFFPRMLAAGLAIFSLILLFNAIIRRQQESDTHFSLKDPGTRRAIISLAATIIYCLCFDLLGFITCTIIYLLFLMLLLKERRYVQMTITALVVTMVVFFIFKVLLNITLPMGTLYGF